MSRIYSYGIVLGCLMVLVGCAKPLKVQRVEMTRQVTPGPGPATQVFSVDDPFAHAWVELQNVAGKHELSWVWIDPHGQSYMQSAPLNVGHGTKRYAQLQASHTMSIAKERAAELPGKWTMQVFLDERQVAKQEFWIKDPTAQVPAAAEVPATTRVLGTADVPATPPAPAITLVFPPERRTALVIGNGNYKSLPRLANPTNDAKDIAAALRKLNFQVTELYDATYRDMKEASRRFARSLEQGGVGLFYFAGHGIQAGGKNYLIPTDAKIERDYEAEYNSLHSSWILDAMSNSKSRVNIIILDACRDNPIARSERSGLQGLAGVQAARGSLIAYSTSPGAVARDGRGRHSPYAKSLIHYLQEPGVQVEQMFKKVRIAVEHTTLGDQTPWESSSLVGDFFFAPK